MRTPAVSRWEDPLPDPDSPFIAYCAPGRRETAEWALERDGIAYRELFEHPYLEGREDQVLVVDTTPLEVTDPVQLAGAPSVDSAFWRYWWYGALVTDPRDMHLLSGGS